MKVLLTGATGFVGGHLYPALVGAGHSVIVGSRHPEKAALRYPDREWVRVDVADADSLRRTMEGCEAAFYLIHGMSGGLDYPQREEEAARNFAAAAADAGLSRIVYLGGMAPQGVPSRHLESRLRTGAILREGRVPTFELRASMIVGQGGASWRICRDLALRLPVMVLPRWLRSKTQPVAIADVVFALVATLDLDTSRSGEYDLPGPETLSVREILERIARLSGNRPIMLTVPFVTPHLSTYWIRLVTRTDSQLAAELVEGLRSNILARNEGIWSLLPEHERQSFDEAARLALKAESATSSVLTRAVERGIHYAGRKV